MDIEEVKEELTKRMAEAHSDYMEDPVDGEYADGYATGCEYAIELLEKSQEKKVKIPELIANDIKYHKKYGSTLRGALGSAFDQDAESDVYYWFLTDDGDENVRKYISAWNNGYKVKKEPKYRVKIDSKLYFQRFEDTEAVFLIDDSLGVKESSPVFTREEGNKILETLDVESGQLEEAED